MSVVSSPSSSAASTFPTTTTTNNDDDDGKVSEEKVEEEDVLSELEQRVTSVEETILVSSSSSSSRRFGEKSDASLVTKSASSKQSVSSTFCCKTREFALGFGGFADTFYRSKNSGKENEIKRLHDRLEKVLFQIAVVGVLKREDEKNGYQSVPFGRSVRAIARDCLVLTFSFGNR